jgi:GTPase SAR1 family protein
MHRFANGRFRAEMTTTVGVGYLYKTIEVDGISVVVQVWDTAGQVRQSLRAARLRRS